MANTFTLFIPYAAGGVDTWKVGYKKKSPSLQLDTWDGATINFGKLPAGTNPWELLLNCLISDGVELSPDKLQYINAQRLGW